MTRIDVVQDWWCCYLQRPFLSAMSTCLAMFSWMYILLIAYLVRCTMLLWHRPIIHLQFETKVFPKVVNVDLSIRLSFADYMFFLDYCNFTNFFFNLIEFDTGNLYENLVSLNFKMYFIFRFSYIYALILTAID